MFQIHGLTLTASLVVQLISLAIPWLVAALVHVSAPGWLKSGLHAVLAAILGAAGVLVSAKGGYDWQAFVQSILSTLVTSGMAYLVVARKIGGPQLEAAGLSLGKQIIMDVTKALPDDTGPKHVATPTLPADQTPPTGNVTAVPPKEGS